MRSKILISLIQTQGSEGTEWSWEDYCAAFSHWDYFLWDPFARKKTLYSSLHPLLLFPHLLLFTLSPHPTSAMDVCLCKPRERDSMRHSKTKRVKKKGKDKGIMYVRTCSISSICIIEGGTLARGRDRASSSFRLRVMMFLKCSRANWRTDGSFPWGHIHTHTHVSTHSFIRRILACERVRTCTG